MDGKTLVDLKCSFHGCRLYFESSGSEARDRRIAHRYQGWVEQSKAIKPKAYYEEEARRTLAEMNVADPSKGPERFDWLPLIFITVVLAVFFVLLWL